MYQLTSVGEAECPQSEVRCSVGDGPQTVLDGVDCLMDEHLPKLKLHGTKIKNLHIPPMSIDLTRELKYEHLGMNCLPSCEGT